MAPITRPRYWDRDELTEGGKVNIISYWPASPRTCWYDVRICLGETRTDGARICLRETRTDTLNYFDLCYSFKMLCQAEYGGTHQLHLTAKNYTRNYSLTTGLHQNRLITYKRALRNLMVLMFSHYVHHLEGSGSLEGHRTLMVHQCLQVLAALDRYHWWQCRVSHQEKSENTDWNKVPVVPKDDFHHKYSPALTLLGNTQNLAFAHPKLLRRCYDNVYHNGQLIGDLTARGKLQTEDQSKKIYTQEYQEVVTRIENSLNLMEESPSYSVIPTSLVNPDIVLPHRLFRECWGLPEIPPGCGPKPREYQIDGTQGLMDLDWSQCTPIFHPDDIDSDPQFTQYPFQEGDDDDDNDEEDMEVESRPPGGAGDASMAPPTNTRRTYQCLPATYSYKSAQTGARPRAHILTQILQWRWEVLVWLPEAQTCVRNSDSQCPSGQPKDHVHPGFGRHCCMWGCSCSNRNPGEIHPAPTGEWGWSSSGWPGVRYCYPGIPSETLGHHHTAYINWTGHFQ